MKLSQISLSTAVLVAILLVAFGLRVWGAPFGLPFVYHPDEGFEVNRALQLGTGEFDFNFFRMVKGGYFYLLFVEFGFLFVIMKILGFVSSTTDFAMWFIRDPSIFYIVGRVTTGVIGTIAVYLLCRIGTRIHSSRVGLIAAALMAVNVLQVVHSHYITVDIPLTCLCLAGLLFIVRVDESGSRADYIGACLFAALATITKLPGVLLVVPLFAVHLKRSLHADRPFLQTFFSKSVIVGGVVFICVFFLSNPGALLHFGDYLSNVTGMIGGGEGGDSNVSENPNHVGFYVSAMYQWIGLPILLASIFGLFVSLKNKIHVMQILLMFALVFFAVISLSSNPYLVYTRYILPIIPVVLLFAALGIDSVAQMLGRFSANNIAIAAMLTLLISSTAIVGSVRENLDFNKKDTRTAAREWFDKNVHEGASVLIQGHTARPSNTGVQLRNSRKNIERAIWYFEQNDEPGKAKYFELELRAVNEKRFDLSLYDWREFEEWSSYANSDIDYVVVIPSALSSSIKYEVVGQRFLEAIRSDPKYSLIMTFHESDAGMRGPQIEIYKRTEVFSD